MLNQEDHLENLLRHKRLVLEATILLGKRLVTRGRIDEARQLIARGFSHDNSKLVDDLEWSFLHTGADTPREGLNTAIDHHIHINKHHPEFHNGLCNMSQLDVQEMCCDWYGRSQEFSTSLRGWAKIQASGKYHIDDCPIQKAWIEEAIDLLLEDYFVR